LGDPKEEFDAAALPWLTGWLAALASRPTFVASAVPLGEPIGPTVTVVVMAVRR